MKLHIHEEFYNNHLIYLFNSLGQYEFKEYKQMQPANIEMIQYLTQNSIQKNFVSHFLMIISFHFSIKHLGLKMIISLKCSTTI